MFSVTNILCGHDAGNEALRYSHTNRRSTRSADSHRPVVVWHVTRACNLRCVHCYASADAEPMPDELTHDEGRDLLDQLKAYGVPAVLFSGGESLVRPDTLELMRYAKSLGMPLTLSTNGMLIDDAVADELADIGVRYVGVSLDGKRPTHDKLRGQVGAFDAALEGIERCRCRGIRVGARFTVHALNLDQLDEVIDLCLAYGIDRLCMYHLAYAGRGSGMQRVDLTAEQTRAAVDRLFDRAVDAHRKGLPLEVLTVGNHVDAAYAVMRLATEHPDQPDIARATFDRLAGTGGNRSGVNICSIDPVGNVHYDQFSWHYTCGNIRHATFREVWGDPDTAEPPLDARLRVLRDRAEHLPDRCRGCAFLGLCNGNLRTRAESASGDWLGDDPACYLTDDEVAGHGLPWHAAGAEAEVGVGGQAESTATNPSLAVASA